MAICFKPSIQLFSQYQGQKATEHVASDILIPLVIDGSGLQHGFHIPEDMFHLPQFLILEGHLFG